MRKLTGLLLCSTLLAASLIGAVACGSGRTDPGKDPGNDPQTPPAEEKFDLLSTLEFFNWNDAKDLVIQYEGGEISGVTVADEAIEASQYTAAEGVLTIDTSALDYFSAGKYELKATSGDQSDTLTLFIGEQIRDGSRYIRRQTGRGESVSFYFDAQGNNISSVKCGETALASSQYTYDAEGYLLTVAGEYFDSLSAGLYAFSVEAGSVSDSFTVLAYGGNGYAASSVFGASYAGANSSAVSLPMELYAAANTEYTVGAEGLSLTGAPEALVSSPEMDEGAIYCLQFKFKTEAAYIALFNGETEVVTLNDTGILSKSDDRTTAEQSDGWWTVNAYFAAADGGLTFRKAANDDSPVILESILLLRTKILDTSATIDMGTAGYRVGSTNDVSFTIPFDPALIAGVSFAGEELDPSVYSIDGYTFTLSGTFLLGENISVDETRTLTFRVVSVTDIAGTVGSAQGTAELSVVGETIEAPQGKALVPWVEGENVTVQVDLMGGSISGVKVGGAEISSDKYTVNGSDITIDASCFAGLSGDIATIEVSNDGGTFTVYANKGELVLTANAEDGKFDSTYNFFAESANSKIVSGTSAISGSYSYQRSGPNDTWNNSFETKPAYTQFVEGDYYLVTFSIRPERKRADSDSNFNEIRTYFDLGSSLSEITHRGQVKRDSNARQDGAAGVWVNEDGTLDIAVTLPAVTNVLHIAFCFEGSAVFDDIMVYHLAGSGSGTQEPEPQPGGLSPVYVWDGEADFSAECTFTSSASVTVNGEAVAAENVSFTDGKLVLKAAYLNANMANSYAVEVAEGNLSAAFMLVRGDELYSSSARVDTGERTADWNNIWSSTDRDITFVANDYYTLTYKIKTVRNRPDTDNSFTEIRSYFEGSGFSGTEDFCEVTYKGTIKTDPLAGTAGAARVIVLEDGTLIISVTLKAINPQELKFAFCYKGSAVYSDVVVTHIGSTLGGSAADTGAAGEAE